MEASLYSPLLLNIKLKYIYSLGLLFIHILYTCVRNSLSQFSQIKFCWHTKNAEQFVDNQVGAIEIHSQVCAHNIELLALWHTFSNPKQNQWTKKYQTESKRRI